MSRSCVYGSLVIPNKHTRVKWQWRVTLIQNNCWLLWMNFFSIILKNFDRNKMKFWLTSAKIDIYWTRPQLFKKVLPYKMVIKSLSLFYFQTTRVFKRKKILVNLSGSKVDLTQENLLLPPLVALSLDNWLYMFQSIFLENAVSLKWYQNTQQTLFRWFLHFETFKMC